jgi:hypothetical protein
MSEELPNAADVSNIDTALFSYEQAKEMLLRSGELVEPGGSKFGLILGGFVVGAGLGGALGFYLTRLKLETKYNKIAEDEIADMRKHYRDKATALENTVAKPNLETLVREQGYTEDPPMAVTPPSSVVEAAKDAVEDPRSGVKEENVFDKPRVSEEEVGMPKQLGLWEGAASSFTEQALSDEKWSRKTTCSATSATKSSGKRNVTNQLGLWEGAASSFTEQALCHSSRRKGRKRRHVRHG